MDAYVAAPRRI